MHATWFQRMTLAALVAVLALIFVGAIVRVSGAGLGCPDWPRCWGCLVPPWKKEQVDLTKIDFERFRAKAERLGRDPSTVTPEHILESFNPVHTWTEFINRLCSLPVGLFTLAAFVLAHWQRGVRPRVFWASFTALALVLFNAWLGARVVYSGLRPGTITLHMAAAMALICVLVYAHWRGCDAPARITLGGAEGRGARWWLAALLLLTVAEGVLGSQVREVTDVLKLRHHEAPRAEWIGELERAWVFLAHRSFSWAILAAAVVFWWRARRARGGVSGWSERMILGIVCGQMVLGLVMARVVIHPVVQVLHVGLSAVLLALLCRWWLASAPAPP